jgi:hypothetical protein
MFCDCAARALQAAALALDRLGDCIGGSQRGAEISEGGSGGVAMEVAACSSRLQ